jgi:hypothetical protein
VPVWIAGRDLVPRARINQVQRKGDFVTRFGLRGIRLDLDGHRPLNHVRIMPAPPQMPAAMADWAIWRHRASNLRHVATLADKAPLLHEKLAFVLGIGPARTHIVELGGT